MGYSYLSVFKQNKVLVGEVEESEDEDFGGDGSPKKHEDPLDKCKEELDELLNTIDDLLTRLEYLAMELNQKGLLKGKGYNKIMNLVKEYSKYNEPF